MYGLESSNHIGDWQLLEYLGSLHASRKDERYMAGLISD